MRLTVVLTDVPSSGFKGCEHYRSVHVARQVGKAPQDARAVESPEHAISFEVEVRPSKASGELDLFGQEVFGTRERRFLYVQWIGETAGGRCEMFRRLKVDLGGISQRQLTAGAPLTVRAEGVAKDGGPACATAKLSAWRESAM